jgi:hypothetical protein
MRGFCGSVSAVSPATTFASAWIGFGAARVAATVAELRLLLADLPGS